MKFPILVMTDLIFPITKMPYITRQNSISQPIIPALGTDRSFPYTNIDVTSFQSALFKTFEK